MDNIHDDNNINNHLFAFNKNNHKNTEDINIIDNINDKEKNQDIKNMFIVNFGEISYTKNNLQYYE